MLDVPKCFGVSEFFQINLEEMLSSLGEEDIKSILSLFKCPQNRDVEYFIREKAIEFSKRGFSKTYLVYWQLNGEKELVGYYTIALKTIKISKSCLSRREQQNIRASGFFNVTTNEFEVAAPLIAQLGKNYSNGNDTLISGSDLLQMAITRVKDIQGQVGGRMVYLECEDKEKLIDFYINNNFKVFAKRKLDGDETNLSGTYLVQLFTIL